MMRRIISGMALSLTLLLAAGSFEAMGQCSMCRAVAETGAKDEATKTGRGLNSGILYLLAMPYVLGGVAFVIWRKNRSKGEELPQ